MRAAQQPRLPQLPQLPDWIFALLVDVERPCRKRELPRCGAKTRAGSPCQLRAYREPITRRIVNGLCRLHGGLSSGPKTPAGRAAIAESNRRRSRPGPQEQ
jgi:hypothetical protein